MPRTWRKKLAGWLSALVALVQITAPGCAHKQSSGPLFNDEAHYQALAVRPDCPELATEICPASTAAPPRTILSTDPPEFRDLTLEEALQLALTHSTVIRDMGGVLLQAPANARTSYLPAIVETDPRFGVETALSSFDAAFNASMLFSKNNQALNNAFLGGGTRILRSDTAVFQKQLTKVAADGSQFTLQHNTDFNANNAPANAFPSAWNTYVEADFRHPLLQGAGVEFNRIAGPTGTPGLFNGVMLARMNTNIALAEFETAIPNLVSDVENAYWDLYFAYRNLDAKIAARNSGLETWRRIHALYVSGRRGGEAEKETQAREQYYAFEEEVQNALVGFVGTGTQTGGGSGGTFHGTGGVQTAERRLRLLIGLPSTDDKVLRPVDEPRMARMAFDWNDVREEAIARRPELRRQRLVIRRRELELIASRNFLLPSLDMVGSYHFQGFGNKLFGNGSLGQFDNAAASLFNDNFQGWNAGLEFAVPLGLRRGHVMVRNAQLQLARERAVLAEQERDVVNDLTNAIAELDRAYVVSQTNFNRRTAARQHVAVVQAAFDADKAPVDLLLYAQLRLSDSDARYYRSLVEYALAAKNVHYQKGSLLDYNSILLADAPDLGRHEPRKSIKDIAMAPLNYAFAKPPVLPPGNSAEAPSTGNGPTSAPGAAERITASGMLPPAIPGDRSFPSKQRIFDTFRVSGTTWAPPTVRLPVPTTANTDDAPIATTSKSEPQPATMVAVETSKTLPGAANLPMPGIFAASLLPHASLARPPAALPTLDGSVKLASFWDISPHEIERPVAPTDFEPLNLDAVGIYDPIRFSGEHDSARR